MGTHVQMPPTLVARWDWENLATFFSDVSGASRVVFFDGLRTVSLLRPPPSAFFVLGESP